jgi:thiamine-phosphate pyrophosphorylase
MNSVGQTPSPAAPSGTAPLDARLRGLYAIFDLREETAQELAERAVELLRGGCRVIQLRAKNAPASLILAHAHVLRKLCQEARALFLINDRLDIALAAKANGVHLGQDDLPPEEARRLAPPGFVIGLSTHYADEVVAASTRPVDYIGYGPIFPTESKADAQKPRGLSGLREAVRLSQLPIVAIGGIEVQSAADVFATGASAIAMIGALKRSRTPRALSETLRKLAGSND